ncbi:MAG: DUF2799 domain-containing protein [Gammaproteobacteria bacterium]
MISLVALSGCAGMNEQACLVTDWRSVGFEDGIAGRSAGSIANYRQQCSKHGVTPDLVQYRAGHAEGVENYCRAGNGFEVGRRGARYQGVCPANLEGEFLSAYNDGRQLYELEYAVREVESEIAARHRRLEQLNKELGSTSIAIISDGTSAEERAQLLIDTASMAAEQGKIAKELEGLEAEHALRQADLQAYRQTIAFAF